MGPLALHGKDINVKLFQVIILIHFFFIVTIQPAVAELDANLLTGSVEADEIDALIAENANSPDVVFDLLAIKAELLTNAGQHAEAAEILLVQAALNTRYPDIIQADQPSLHLDSADLFKLAGQRDRELEQLYATLDTLRDRAPSREILTELLERIATIEDERGNSDIASQLRDRAANATPRMDKPLENRSDDAGFSTVNIYYATDRARSGKSRPARFYGSGRANGLDFGIAEVTIPNTHVAGALEAPSVWRLEFSPNPAKHVMLQSITPVEKNSFFSSMRAELAQSGANDAFVFVHGYNVSFDAAAKRTAQLAFDMNFKGLPVLYSWPSKGATIGYIPDTAVVRLSGRRLTDFLEELVEQSGATTVHVVAHSMGNRAVTDALELMALRKAPLTKPVFDQIIFAAPDVDKGLFAEMLPTIRPLANRLTLYASEKDWALEASRKLHGSQPRAGQGGDDALAHVDIDTIDMSILGDDMLAHSYVANDQSAILDISMLFWRNLDPQKRCGLRPRVDSEPTQIWNYEKDLCQQESLLSIVGSLRNAGAISKAEVKETLKKDFADDVRIKELEPLLLDLAAD